MITNFQHKWIGKLLLGLVFSLPMCLFAQDEQASDNNEATATIKLDLLVVDSVKTCKATVMAGEKPIEGAEVRFFVKRFFSPLPLIPNGKSVSTDEEGVASVEFPNDLPGDLNGMVVITANVEDNDDYGSFEATDSVKWGTIAAVAAEEEEWNKRSLAGTGGKVPGYLIGAALVIISIVWGVLVYVMISFAKIKKAGGAIMVQKT